MPHDEFDPTDIEFLEEHKVKPLNPSKIPKHLHPLIPLAQKWGVIDTVARGMIVDQASNDTLEEIIHTVERYSTALYDWLEGPESRNRPPSYEYVVFSCLMLASDSARHRLQQRQK